MSSIKIEIQPIGKEYLTDIEHLHRDCLSGQLSLLGRFAVQAFYRTAAKMSGAHGWVAVQNGRAIGFILGRTSGTGLMKDVLKASTLPSLFLFLIGAILHPFNALRILSETIFGKPPPHDPRCPELTYIAVDPEHRQQGVGRLLFETFRGRAGKKFELSVGEKEVGAIKFYDAMGGTVVGNYCESGVAKVRYSFVGRN